MLKIKLFKDEDLGLVEFETYEQALEWEALQLEEYKTTNKVIDENKDRSYIRYKDEIQRLVDSTCPKCVIEEHNGIFCRCESRNIQVAKRQRERHESTFQSQTCTFCINPDSILTKETCCTGCSKLIK